MTSQTKNIAIETGAYWNRTHTVWAARGAHEMAMWVMAEEAIEA